MSSLRRGHVNLLCIVPILVYVLPKRALSFIFNWIFLLEFWLSHTPTTLPHQTELRTMEPWVGTEARREALTLAPSMIRR